MRKSEYDAHVMFLSDSESSDLILIFSAGGGGHFMKSSYRRSAKFIQEIFSVLCAGSLCYSRFE